MAEKTTTHDVSPEAPKRNNRRPIVAFCLAVLAVGGIGAAVTSAAWTDNTFFAAPAAAATFNLEGSLDGVSWSESDDPDSIQIVVPAGEFADLLPGQSRTVDLWVRNGGSVSAALTSQVVFSDSSTFQQDPSVTVKDLTSRLTPAGSSGASDRFELTVTTPSNWSSENQGATGTVIVTIAATATA